MKSRSFHAQPCRSFADNEKSSKSINTKDSNDHSSSSKLSRIDLTDQHSNTEAIDELISRSQVRRASFDNQMRELAELQEKLARVEAELQKKQGNLVWDQFNTFMHSHGFKFLAILMCAISMIQSYRIWYKHHYFQKDEERLQSQLHKQKELNTQLLAQFRLNSNALKQALHNFAALKGKTAEYQALEQELEELFILPPDLHE
jgi:phosphoribosylaminoimidazole-succinocarboxamide synthase